MPKHIKNFEDYTMNEEFLFKKKEKSPLTPKINELESILNQLPLRFDELYFSIMKEADEASSFQELIELIDRVIQELNESTYLDQYEKQVLSDLIEFKSKLQEIN